MKTMNKTLFIIGLVSIICVLSLSGCGKDNDVQNNNINSKGGNGNINTSSAAKDNDSITQKNRDNDENSLIDFSSATQGSVVEFSNDSCIINLTLSDGDIAYSDAPGHEKPENNVTIHYNNDCIFQIAIINSLTGEINLSEADISDVKKQSPLIIYGDNIDKYNINASRVIIAYYK